MKMGTMPLEKLKGKEDLENLTCGVCGKSFKGSGGKIHCDDCRIFVDRITSEKVILSTSRFNKEDFFSRDVLIELCEKSIYPINEWDENLSTYQGRIGKAWAYLKAGCDFTVVDVKENSVELEILYRGFSDFKSDTIASNELSVLLYLD